MRSCNLHFTSRSPTSPAASDSGVRGQTSNGQNFYMHAWVDGELSIFSLNIPSSLYSAAIGSRRESNSLQVPHLQRCFRHLRTTHPPMRGFPARSTMAVGFSQGESAL